MARIPSVPRPRGVARTAAGHPEGVRLIPVEGASAIARPETIADTYLELGYGAQQLEQIHLFAAEGELHARRDAAKVKSLAYAADHAKSSINRAKAVADTATQRYDRVRDVLSPSVRRKATSSRGYVIRNAGLLVGDVTGLGGAGIAFGEYPAMAIAQAMSAGIATVTAGLAATQLRHLQQAAERPSHELPEALEPYRHLFVTASIAKRAQAAVFVVAALIAIFVAAGIFALRTAIEGPLSGVTFGMLAAAIALASFINSWHHADVVADAIESAHHDALRADRHHRRVSRGRLVRDMEQAAAQEKSVIIEYTHRGLAAAAHIEADKYRALLASPDVVGHGPAPKAASPLSKRARPA